MSPISQGQDADQFFPTIEDGETPQLVLAHQGMHKRDDVFLVADIDLLGHCEIHADSRKRLASCRRPCRHPGR
jgi:hypothetical protein